MSGKKYQIQVIAYDDQYKSPEAVAAYQRLVYEDGVQYIVIAVGASTMAIKRYCDDDKVVCMTCGYIADETDPSLQIYLSHMEHTSGLLPPLYEWFKNNTKDRRVAILNPDGETAREMAALSKSLLKKVDYTVVANEL